MDKQIIILNNWEKAKHAIAECKSIDEVKNIRDKAEALRAYAQQARETLEIQNNIVDIKVRAERKMGEFSKELPIQKGKYQQTSHDGKSDKSNILKEAGIKHYERYEAMANLPEDVFNKYIEETKKNNERLATGGIVKFAKELERKDRTNKLLSRDNKILPTNILLLEGDVFDQIKKIEDKSVDLLITDPPYFMNKADWDTFKSRKEFLDFTKQWIEAILPKLKDQYNIFISFNPEYFADLEIICRDLELPIKSRLIWHYRNAGGKSAGKFMFSRTYEPILHIGNRELNFGEEWTDERFDVWTIAVPQSNFDEGKFHPTQKPLDLFRRLIELGSKKGDIVADIFAGSGTTGIACKELERVCIMIERDPEYIKIIKNRL